eukprot:729088-Prorocentrum_lima.AAC.1
MHAHKNRGYGGGGVRLPPRRHRVGGWPTLRTACTENPRAEGVRHCLRGSGQGQRHHTSHRLRP